VIHLIEKADHSAARLVNILAESFPCFKDDVKFERKKPVRFLKRAQIFVADLWAAFEGEGYGRFDDIDKITMFAGSVSPVFPTLPRRESVSNKQAIKPQTTASPKSSTPWAQCTTAHPWSTASKPSAPSNPDIVGKSRSAAAPSGAWS
jgi:hypothetical protein